MRIRLTVWLICFLSVVASGLAQQIHKEQRVPPTDFAIMGWGSASPDAQQLQWMKDAA